VTALTIQGRRRIPFRVIVQRMPIWPVIQEPAKAGVSTAARRRKM